MVRQHSTISLKEAIDFCLENDGSDLDSPVGGLSSDEEQEIDTMLADNYERWPGFSLVSAFFSDNVSYVWLGRFSLFKNRHVYKVVQQDLLN